jgi:hypothetical protein
MRNTSGLTIKILLPIIAIALILPAFLVSAETEIPDDFGPEFTYQTYPIAGELAPGETNQHGPYYPYVITVRLNTVNPSGKKLTVSIWVNGVQRWSGSLGAGQQSATITCDGGTTYVRLKNNNSVDVYYTGTVYLIYN